MWGVTSGLGFPDHLGIFEDGWFVMVMDDQEDGSGGAPGTDAKRQKRVKKVMNVRTHPATPQPAATIAHRASWNSGSRPAKTTATAPPPSSCNGPVELALSVLGSNVDDATNARAEQREGNAQASCG